MSKLITDWIKTDLYPSLFESIDRALPEHDFKRASGVWMSKHYLNGSPHARRDKTVVSSRAPGYISEQGGERMSLVDYVIQRDGVEFIQAVETLARVVGLQLPQDKDYDKETYQRAKDKATLLEEANSYFIYCLETSTGAKEIKKYLQTRGYSPEEAQAMELGYIPSQEKLFTYLKGKGYNKELIEEALPLKVDTRIGGSHSLSIPYRSGGSIKGFKFRTVGDATPKYLNTSGLDKSGGFFNLLGIKGDKDLIIVEGELDSLHATVKGIENVVALGGSSISQSQVEDAIRRGAKSFTICLDTEPGKEENTVKRISSAIETILPSGVDRIYVATLPDLGGGKTDPDRLIKEKGVEDLRRAITGAQAWYDYYLNSTREKYIKLEEEKGLGAKNVDNYLEEVVGIATRIESPLYRDIFYKLFTDYPGIKESGVTQERLQDTVEKLRYDKAKEAQAKSITTLLASATKLQTEGKVEDVIAKIETGLQEIRMSRGKDLLPPPQSYENLLHAIADTPPALNTGYKSLDEFIGFTPGAITLVAGRPGHGKTTLLFNLLLQMSQGYPGDKFHFFSYEEPLKNISIKLLNRLTATDLSGYFRDTSGLARSTNYEFIKHYIKNKRDTIKELEEGKRLFKDLIDSQRIVIYDKSYSVEQLQSLLSYLNKKEKIGAVLIDYIQRMSTERRTQDKRTEIAHISDQVLQIAKETGLPIILGAQLNRAAGERPKQENLKEAGNLEEDANTVLSIYCEAREKEEDESGDKNSIKREVELEIKALKNREGEVNRTGSLIFDRYTGVIKDRAPNSNPF